MQDLRRCAGLCDHDDDRHDPRVNCHVDDGNATAHQKLSQHGKPNKAASHVTVEESLAYCSTAPIESCATP